MNLYLRYFDRETLVFTVDEAIEFLTDINEFDLSPEMEADIRAYVASDIFYPKRYKVKQRAYFIVIKTDAASMEDFKAKRALHDKQGFEQKAIPHPIMQRLNEEKFGWYEGHLDFKRVVIVPNTGKFQYSDTCFVARVKANSAMDCYNRIVEHLKLRVDERSQFPSVKGKNFKFKYLGAPKPIDLAY